MDTQKGRYRSFFPLIAFDKTNKDKPGINNKIYFVSGVWDDSTKFIPDISKESHSTKGIKKQLSKIKNKPVVRAFLFI